MLCSNNVQEVMDFALIAQAATLESRIPFLHFFDGFRTSHEVQKIEELTFDDMRAMIDDDLVAAHRARALTPDRPAMRGTAQNPDVYFQGRETVNKYYAAVPGIVQEAMDKFAKLTGRQYQLFDYVGAPDAERVVVMMGSGAETAAGDRRRTSSRRARRSAWSRSASTAPSASSTSSRPCPRTVKKIAVLDRTKEPGALGEPLYLDVRTAIGEAMADGQARVQDVPRHRRRPLRPRLEGVHPAPWPRRSSTT